MVLACKRLIREHRQNRGCRLPTTYERGTVKVPRWWVKVSKVAFPNQEPAGRGGGYRQFPFLILLVDKSEILTARLADAAEGHFVYWEGGQQCSYGFGYWQDQRVVGRNSVTGVVTRSSRQYRDPIVLGEEKGRSK